MFIDTALKIYIISEQDKMIGKLGINESLIGKSHFIRPFIRETETKTVIKVGDRDYEKLNQYIISSMKDYYERLLNTSSTSEKSMMISTYNHLYGMWKELHKYIKSANFIEMDKTYDLFSYELYVLGYME